MNIFVGGSLKEVPQNKDRCLQFVTYLGQRIVERGHTLLGGCRGSLDMAVAEAAQAWLVVNGRDKSPQLISYRLSNDQPSHKIGRILVSARKDWELSHPDLSPPEQIAEADVTVFIAGSHGTLAAANWARIAKKPILGISQFGGAARDIGQQERSRFKELDSYFVPDKDFEVLIDDTDEMDQLASNVISLSERIVASNSVFIIMPFTDEFADVYLAYRTVCKKNKFEALRTDKSDWRKRIIPRILSGIRQSAFVIADVTTPAPNVYYEIGLAEGMGKQVIFSARRGITLPFDIADIPVLFWSNIKELKKELGRRIQEIAPIIRKSR